MAGSGRSADLRFASVRANAVRDVPSTSGKGFPEVSI